MEIIEAAKTNIGILLLTIIGGGGVISIAFAAWTAMMAHGDPQQMAKARNAFLGGIGGLIIGGFAFAIPQILSETVLQPSGGQGFGTQEAGSCDDIFKRELILQPNANTTARMNQVIRVIQQREDDCLEDNWDPTAMSGVPIATADTWAGVRGSCIDQAPANTVPTGGYTIDGLGVPAGLLIRQTNGASTTHDLPSASSFRDVNDNLIVYFEASKRPTDLARCWMYLSRDQLWVTAGQ